jgi:hypothetical protein
MVFDITEYAAATPTISGEYKVKLLAQLRNTGRILNGFRFTTDGPTIKGQHGPL